jgi:nicotinamidase-related amidase
MTNRVPPIDLSRTALLVMDFQHAVLGILDSPEALLERTSSAIDLFRQHGGQVAVVRAAFLDQDFDAIPSRSGMASIMSGAGRAMHDQSDLTAVHESVAPHAGDIVLRKTRFSAFSTTDLDSQLRERAIDTLVLTGISTGGSVLSTTLDAFDRDYLVYVLKDACDDPDQEVHDFLTTKVLPEKSHVVSCARFETLLTDLPDS